MLLRRPSFINVPFWVAWWVRVYNGSPRSIVLLSLRTQRSLTFVSGFHPGFLMQWKVARQEPLHCIARLNSSSAWILLWLFLHLNLFLRSFRPHFRAICRTEMANVKQTQKMIPFVTCEIALCQYVCELVLGVNVFDLDFLGPTWFDRKTQSRATLWALETCLIVGLLPFLIILITASLSSNTYNKASWYEDWTFEGTRSTLFKTLNIPRDCTCAWLVSRQTTGFTVLSWFWVVFPRTATIRSHKSRAGKTHLTSILHPKKWFCESVELWETEVSFLHIQLALEQMFDIRRTQKSPQGWFRIFESWNNPYRQCCAVFPTWQYCLY